MAESFASGGKRQPVPNGGRIANRSGQGLTSACDIEFEKLVSDHSRRITRMVYRLLGWSDGVEDVVQEVFLSALKNLKSFRGESEISTWLTRIAVNKCHSHRRKLRVRLKALASMANASQPDDKRGPVDGLMDRETFGQVRRAVRALPVIYRDVVVLRYLEQMSAEQVAEVLGISRSAVDVRLHRARKRLRELLAGLMAES